MQAPKELNLEIQYADVEQDWSQIFPEEKLREWIKAALMCNAMLTIRFVGEAEGRSLNHEFRGKDYPTNVLTFEYEQDDILADLPQEVREQLLADVASEVVACDELAVDHAKWVQADIVVCGSVLEREASEQGKRLNDHAAHIVVHGVLHAQGYDHLEDDEAEQMENLEIQILAHLGIANPYQ